jgi:RNA polymerase sigma-70 factor (ECF subfamily)
LTPTADRDEDAADDLVDRLQRRDVGAVGEVYDRHHAAVRAFARRLVGDPATAEDLVHEVFVTLPRVAHRFKGDSSIRTFLISIAVNHARHFVRGAARRRLAMQRYAEVLDAEASHVDQHARRLELARLLTSALDQLPIDQRVAFVLCEVEGHTSVEAARIVAAPEATVRTRLFHAKKRLRALLGEGAP